MVAKAYITDYGLHMLNRAVANNGEFAILSTAKMNDASLMLSEGLDELPLPSITGYVGDVIYDPGKKGIIIQTVFEDTEYPDTEFNGVGVYDNSGKLVCYSREITPLKYRKGMTLKYYIFIRLYQNVDYFNQIVVDLPKDKVINKLYVIETPSVNWKIVHNLNNPFVNFKIYDGSGQLIREDKYSAVVQRGVLYITFTDGVPRLGYISVVSESIHSSFNEGLYLKEPLVNDNYSTKSLDEIDWVDGILVK